jgi:hypothetical protein
LINEHPTPRLFHADRPIEQTFPTPFPETGCKLRMASLVAVGDVRTLRIDQKSFEGLICERLGVSLAVMKVEPAFEEASLKN